MNAETLSKVEAWLEKEKLFLKYGFESIDYSLKEVGYDNTLKISASKMYEYVEVTFDDLEKLSKFFDTRKINFKNGYSSDGCETCNYGSKYTVDVYVSGIDWTALESRLS